MNKARTGDEEGRLAALKRYAVMDTTAEPQFDRVTALVCAALDVPMAAISLLDRDRQWFKSKQNLGVDETPRDIAFCDHTIRTPNAMIVCDARLDPRFSANPLVTNAPHLLSYAGVPLQTPDGYNIGTICALDTRARSFSPSQMDTLGNLAAVTIDALEVRMIANFDHLTGAFSRRAFLSQLDLAISRRSSPRARASLLLFDLDFFKVVNDSYGHAAGDHVLRDVATVCRHLLGQNDVIGRIGGEEFAILLPEAGAGTAMQVAERLRAAIEALRFSPWPALRVTASFGVAELQLSTAGNADWLEAADKFLYAAKRNGRNRCEGDVKSSTACVLTFDKPALAHSRRSLRE